MEFEEFDRAECEANEPYECLARDEPLSPADAELINEIAASTGNRDWDDMSDENIVAVYRFARDGWEFNGFEDVCEASTWMSAEEWAETWGDQRQERWQRIHKMIAELDEDE